MTREEPINLTDKWLKSSTYLKTRIRLTDFALKKSSYDTLTMNKLKRERAELHCKLSSIIKAVGILEEENQRIICYRYFNNLTNSEIALRVGLSLRTIPRRLNKLLLYVGRVMFGFEDEFWNEVFND